jgi:hypothetical protein
MLKEIQLSDQNGVKLSEKGLERLPSSEGARSPQ